MRILAISGSTRRESLNTRLAHLVGTVRDADEVTVVADLHRLPYYDGDVEAAGTPAPVAELRAAVAAADAVVFVSPEYNGATPGVLANAVDWLSRPYGESTLRGKPTLVLSASVTPYGGSRAATRLREVLTEIGAVVSPEHLAVAAAHERLTTDTALTTDLSTTLRAALATPDLTPA
ncbi:FMN reductase [Pilimelia anulata]|uniref:FMN reductase n=1 Tax=Pilimelia anulata TaxID=53371 RepID=A0A8J3F8T2_9ACTN|nr:NADPH-dependent FMN reductase [Pilimelia anulata]GGJ94311.1 FMN reductase [Pilimelia anulata]